MKNKLIKLERSDTDFAQELVEYSKRLKLLVSDGIHVYCSWI